MDAFDEVDFPIALGREASVSPSFSTAIVTTASGAEQRNADWANARLRYDVGPGVRSEADIATLIFFFRARHGAARGFRLRDPFDDSSNGMTGTPGFADQVLGNGDGTRTAFALIKHYGGQQRQIMVVKLKLVGRSGAGVSGIASPGRVTGGADAPHGATVLALMDLPALEDSPPTVPRLWIAAAGELPGWRRAALSVSLDGEASWRALDGTGPPAVIGAAATVLGAGSACLLDETGSVEIELLHDAMALAGRDDIAADATANFALLGDELLQFAVATQLSATRWRLGRLLRGRRGTEYAVGSHALGERFVLLEPETMVAFDPPTAAIGGPVALMASGLGDTIPAEDGLTLIGRALRPPAPAQLRVTASSGDIAIAWVRRSRAGWRWLDGGDAPLAEESERYRIVIRDADGAGRTAETTIAELLYTAAEQSADGVTGALTIEVAQLGAGGGSLPPASMTFTGA